MTTKSHVSVSAIATHAGNPKGKWFQRSSTGDSFVRDHDAWGERCLEIDRHADRYREVLVFRDGTRLESTAALHDHGEPARRRGP